MGSKLLPSPLFSLPTGPPALYRLSAVSSLLPLSSSSRLAITRTTPLGFQTAILFPAVGRRRTLTVMAADDNSEVEVDGEGTLENVNEDLEASEVDSDAQVEAKPQRKPRIKLGDIMGILNKRAIEASEKERPVPDIRTGDIVEIKLEVPENKRRLSIYKGIVISRQNAGIHTTIRIRRIIAGVGVEIVFPLYSPNMKEIKVVNHRKVRRARLYYLRDKLPRLSTFK